MDKLRISSLNVRGLKNKLKRISLFNYLKSQRFDIVCLQESHITKNDISSWQKQWGGKIFFNEGTNRSKGEAILVSKHFNGKVDLEVARERMMIVSVLYGNYDLKIANVYAPNEVREKNVFSKLVYCTQ